MTSETKVWEKFSYFIYVDRFDTTDPDNPKVFLQEGFPESSDYQVILHGCLQSPDLDIKEPILEDGFVKGFRMTSHEATRKAEENMRVLSLRNTAANAVRAWGPPARKKRD